MSEERPPRREENSSDSNRADLYTREIYHNESIPSAHASTAGKFEVGKSNRCDEEEDDEYSIGDDENEFDDEATIEQEENMQNSSDIASELEALQKEQDIPIEDLMKLYGCGCHALEVQSSSGGGEIQNSSSNADEPNSSSSNENNSFGSDYVRTVTTISSNVDENDAEDDEGKVPRDIRFLASANSITEDDDEDYTPEDEWRKEIRIGESYQADVNDVVMEPLSQTYETAAGETMIFDPSRLSQKDIEDYLQKFQALVGEAPPSSFVANDNEIALEILCQNTYNVAEALSCISNYDYRTEKSKRNALFGWTEDDRISFENCLHSHGKDFNFVSRCLVGKTMRQIVHYYYHWKISPYHAHFVDSLEKDYNDFIFTIQQMRENELATYQLQNSTQPVENHQNRTNSSLPASLNKSPPRPPFPFRITNENGRTKLRWTAAAAPPSHQVAVDVATSPNHHYIDEHYSTHAGCNLLPHMEALNVPRSYDLTASEPTE